METSKLFQFVLGNFAGKTPAINTEILIQIIFDLDEEGILQLPEDGPQHRYGTVATIKDNPYVGIVFGEELSIRWDWRAQGRGISFHPEIVGVELARNSFWYRKKEGRYLKQLIKKAAKKYLGSIGATIHHKKISEGEAIVDLLGVEGVWWGPEDPLASREEDWEFYDREEGKDMFPLLPSWEKVFKSEVPDLIRGVERRKEAIVNRLQEAIDSVQKDGEEIIESLRSQM